MKKWVVFTIILAILIAASVFFVYYSYFSPKQAESSTGEKIIVTEENFPSYLSLTNPIQGLPNNALLQLVTTDNNYIVTKGSVKEGITENPDITIVLPSSYIPKLSDGFCKTMSEAYKNGDLTLTLHQSEFAAAWKYKSLLQYKSCLGM